MTKKTGIAKLSGSFTGKVSEIRYYANVGQPLTEAVPGDFDDAADWMEFEPQTETEAQTEDKPEPKRRKK
jgi:hypothetical protein